MNTTLTFELDVYMDALEAWNAGDGIPLPDDPDEWSETHWRIALAEEIAVIIAVGKDGS